MSEVKVNKISPRTNCGTVTLGDSGDTFTIPAGVSITNSGTASGFGATGAASWNTTVKTGDFTAVAGEGYFVNTTSGEIDVTLPAGTPGAVVAIKDYAKTFDTNNCILIRNGSDKIGGDAINATLSIEGQAVTLVFIDSTQGWLVTDSGLQSDASTTQFVTATGGTITESGNFKIHTFTGPGTFQVTCAGNAAGSNTVDYLVVAAGGGGNINRGGGGGAGGYRESSGAASGCYSVSPLGSGVPALPVSVQSYSIVVGAGGAGIPAPGPNTQSGNPGSVSTFSTITSTGGGGGGGRDSIAGSAGGSGGGGGGTGPAPGTSGAAGAGNTPPVSPPQGQNGGGGTPGSAALVSASGGGGATVAGTSSPTSPSAPGGPGGNGATSSINGTPTARAGGGGGGTSEVQPIATGGTGGGGSGGQDGGSIAAQSGTANTGGGGGGGGGGNTDNGGTGGSGIVIIRYKFQ